MFLSLTFCCQALELGAPDVLRVGEEFQLTIRDLNKPGLLIINTDFHTEVMDLPAGTDRFTIGLKQSGLIGITIKSGGDEKQLQREVRGSLEPHSTRLEVNPRSEPVGTGQVQVLSWGWDKAFNPIPPPGDLMVSFPKGQEKFEQRPIGLLSEKLIQTTKLVGLVEIELGAESAVFRQVPGPPQPFELTKLGDTIRTSNLLDAYGNLLEDGTVVSWVFYSGKDVHSTGQSSVLNGIASVAMERTPSRELELKLEVLGQTAWIKLTEDD